MEIQIADPSHINPLFQIYKDCKKALDAQGIPQWTDTYPNIETLKKDIENKEAYILKDKKQLLGVVVLNEQQDQQYTNVDWRFNDKKILVIHLSLIHI